MYSTSWRRPQNVPFPKTWSIFERQTSDGEILKFHIQDMTEEYYEDVFSIIEKYFLTEETFHKTAGISNPSEHFTFIRGLVQRIMLPQGISLVCVVEDKRIQSQQTKSDTKVVVGYNLLGVAIRSEDVDTTEWERHETGKRFLAILRRIKEMSPDLMAKYDVQKYVGSLGLCIHPDYRGMKIAEELLKARLTLCKAIGINLTYSAFTASASQKIAAKLGFTEESCVTYEEAEEKLEFKFITKQTQCKIMSCFLG